MAQDSGAADVADGYSKSPLHPIFAAGQGVQRSLVERRLNAVGNVQKQF